MMDQAYSQHCATLLTDLRNCLRGTHFLLDLPVYCKEETEHSSWSSESSADFRTDSGGQAVEKIGNGPRPCYQTSSLLLASLSPFLSGDDSIDALLLPDVKVEHLQLFINRLLQWNWVPSREETELMLNMFRLLGTEFLLTNTGLTILEVTHSLQTLDSVAAGRGGGPPASAPVLGSLGRRNLRKQVIYQCDRCQKQFTTRRALTYHLNSHFGLKPYRCGQCSKAFSQKSHLNVHMKIHSGVKPHVCFHCGKRFAIASNMKKHLSLHERDVPVRRLSKEEGDFEENEAEVQIEPPGRTTTSTVENHVEVSEAQSRSEDCVYCDQTFPGQPDLMAQHLALHASCLQVRCSSCATLFATEAELRAHSGECDGRQLVIAAAVGDEALARRGQHVCLICDKHFKSASRLKVHSVTHTGDKPFSCSLCTKAFTQSSHLNTHMKSKHAPLDATRPDFTCDECPRRFTAKDSLEKHRMLHRNEKPHACPLCPKAYVQKSHLAVHMVRHTGVKPHLCIVCGKGFTTRGHLKSHSQLHTGEKRVYQCVQCNAQYFGFHDLQVHLRWHSGEFPFPCDLCTKKFRSARNLHNHRRVHSGEKPFKCRHCNKAFTATSGLNQHIKRNSECRATCTSMPGFYSLRTQESIHLDKNGPKLSAATQPEHNLVILETVNISIAEEERLQLVHEDPRPS